MSEPKIERGGDGRITSVDGHEVERGMSGTAGWYNDGKDEHAIDDSNSDRNDNSTGE